MLLVVVGEKGTEQSQVFFFGVIDDSIGPDHIVDCPEKNGSMLGWNGRGIHIFGSGWIDQPICHLLTLFRGELEFLHHLRNHSPLSGRNFEICPREGAKKSH